MILQIGFGTKLTVKDLTLFWLLSRCEKNTLKHLCTISFPYLKWKCKINQNKYLINTLKETQISQQSWDYTNKNTCWLHDATLSWLCIWSFCEWSINVWAFWEYVDNYCWCLGWNINFKKSFWKVSSSASLSVKCKQCHCMHK